MTNHSNCCEGSSGPFFKLETHITPKSHCDININHPYPNLRFSPIRTQTQFLLFQRVLDPNFEKLFGRVSFFLTKLRSELLLHVRFNKIEHVTILLLGDETAQMRESFSGRPALLVGKTLVVALDAGTVERFLFGVAAESSVWG